MFLRLVLSALMMFMACGAQAADALEHWRRSTVSLGKQIIDGVEKHFAVAGSALLVATDPQHVCVVTAKHVVYDPKEGIAPEFLYLRLPKDTANNEEDLGVRVDLLSGNETLWKSLPDGSDLAIIINPDLSKYWNVHAVGLQDFASDADIFQGAQILVLGYPGLLGQSVLTTPLARAGIISWIDPQAGLSAPFLVDANIFNGNSGGPVFHTNSSFDQNGNVQMQRGMKFIGIVVVDAQEPAFVYRGDQQVKDLDQSSGKPLPYYALVKNIGGIGIVEPVSKVRKLVEAFCH